MTDDTTGARDAALINLALESCLARCGWTVENFSHHLNAMARSLGLSDEMHRKTPRRWLYGAVLRPARSVPA